MEVISKSGIRWTNEAQLKYMTVLVDTYHDHMEGCDYEEFVKWSALYCAASLLLKAMKEDEQPSDIEF